MNGIFKEKYVHLVKLLRKQGRKLQRTAPLTHIFEEIRRGIGLGTLFRQLELHAHMSRNNGNQINDKEGQPTEEEQKDEESKRSS